MNKIVVKLFIGFLCMAILTIGLLWLIQAGFMNDSYLKNRVGAVESAVAEAAQSTAANYDQLAESLNVNLILLASDGSLQSSIKGVPMMGMILRTCQSMIPDQIDGKVRLLDSLNSSVRYALLGVKLKDGGYLFAMFSLADVDEAARILRNQLWLITAVLILASVMLAMILARRFARPVRAVTAAARELAAGNLAVNLPVESRDELGELTMALNELSVELQKTDNLRKELIANVSHELRAPLSVIQGYAETVRDVTWPDEAKRTRQLDMISQEAARLSRVVTDILNYSKLQAGVDQLNIISFPVCPVLSGLLARYELTAAAKSLTLALDCPEQQILFDRDRFEQVLNNLTQNALNHADPDTTVHIRVVPQDGYSRIYVENTGEVIPAGELPQIWDRYYRAQSIREDHRLGTGLGLAIVKTICEKHQVIYGVSSENRRTIFWFDTKRQVLADHRE